ncbi:MAG: replicative DNA helicase [Pedosphaera sp.]|nr:replicative DNA helicase [Pedosphaera sp.]MST00916.1 replicative DNA helicase [Pedosphaera sp.]
MIDANETPPNPPADFARTRRRKPAAAPLHVDRPPPHSPEAEMGVLGCLLLSPNDGLDICLERIRAPIMVTENRRGAADSEPQTAFFYDLKHQTIFEALIEMREQKEAIDTITLQQRLKDKKVLDQIGGLAYLLSLANGVTSPANLRYYLDIVWDKYILRKMVQTCLSMVSQAYEFEGEMPRLLDEVESRILRINEERVKESNTSMKALVAESFAKIELYHGRKGAITGLSTGFPDFDKLTDGLHGGEMIVIAARPSMGKTSLAMNIADHVTIEQQKPAAVFSLEMTAASLVERMIFSRARMDHQSVRAGFMAERDFPKLLVAGGKLTGAPLYVDDTPGLSILQLRARARRMHHQHGIKLIIIDYLQLLHSTSRRASDNRQQEIAEISGGVKSLAKELNVPVIVLAQLNREMERDKNRKPRLSDLRESGAIEQDADLVGLLYKANSSEDEESVPREEVSGAGVPINLLIAKQRNGPTGDVNFTFLKSYTRFESVSRVSSEDVPTE